MKTCAHCGLENADDAPRCSECGGTEFVVAPAPSADATARWEKVAVLAHEVEAERLGVELNNRNIPHLLRSYYDSALDGLYQSARGWGHVQAPAQYKDAILSVLNDIREARSEADTTSGADPDDAA